MVFLISTLLLACLLVACGEKADDNKERNAPSKGEEKKGNENKADLGDFSVFLEGEIVEEGDKFVVEGIIVIYWQG